MIFKQISGPAPYHSSVCTCLWRLWTFSCITTVSLPHLMKRPMIRWNPQIPRLLSNISASLESNLKLLVGLNRIQTGPTCHVPVWRLWDFFGAGCTPYATPVCEAMSSPVEDKLGFENVPWSVMSADFPSVFFSNLFFVFPGVTVSFLNP